MPKVNVASQVSLDLDDVIESIAKLEITELENFADKIIDLRARRRVPSIPQSEGQLIAKINNGVSLEERHRYEQLAEKMFDESITNAEHQEYLLLIDKIKMADAQRIRDLIQLAELRNDSLDSVMDDLGIRQANYG